MFFGNVHLKKQILFAKNYYIIKHDSIFNSNFKYSKYSEKNIYKI